MDTYRLGTVESRFANLIWQHEPLSSRDLVELAEKELGWKKSTTYTVLKKLSDRGIFKNEDGIVSSVLGKEEFYSLQSESVVNQSFNGSLPAFLNAYISCKSFTKEDLFEIKKLIVEIEKTIIFK